ncbi:hypothetical protein, partial [Staphylococcus aureus]|uniref:hypothetical protein n=1 Tax=Staphylococcus aureus TaxID=1280 RepID=UPI001022F01A
EHDIDIMKFPYFDNAGNGIFERPIASREVTLADGKKVKVATVYDLMTSQYGIRRFNHELEAKGFDDAETQYTPALQEAVAGVKQDVITQVANEFAQNAIDTGGRSMII